MQKPYQPGTPCSVATLCNMTGTTLSGRVVPAIGLDCIRCLYGTIDYVPVATEKNSVAVTNYLNEVFTPAHRQYTPLLTTYHRHKSDLIFSHTWKSIVRRRPM